MKKYIEQRALLSGLNDWALTESPWNVDNQQATKVKYNAIMECIGEVEKAEAIDIGQLLKAEIAAAEFTADTRDAVFDLIDKVLGGDDHA